MSSQESNKFPFKFQSLRPEETAKLKENFSDYLEFVRVGPRGYIFSADYKNIADNIYNISIKTDDIIVASFPRSGTTWTQELAWLIKNDLDYEEARSTPLAQRYTFLEISSILKWDVSKKLSNNVKDVNIEILKSISISGPELLANCPSPRFIKTHLPLSFLPVTTIDTAKMVYVARDPRDVAVSYYHLSKLFKHVNYQGDFKTFWELFSSSNLVLWSPYFEHLKESWALRDHPNMLFLFYEELSKNLPAVALRVADFLGKQLSEEQLAGLCDHLSFENFKKNDSVNFDDLKGTGVLDLNENFIRKGKAGGWREYFDEEMRENAERWIADNLRDTDLRFPDLHH